MKEIFLILAITLLVLPSQLVAQVTEVVIPKSETLPSNDSAPLFVVVEEMPIFKYKNCNSTKESFRQYCADSIRTPLNECEGKAIIQFVVERDGTVGNTKVLVGIKKCDGYEKEIKRLISSMPKWIPGKQNGIYARVLETMEINFSNVKERAVNP